MYKEHCLLYIILYTYYYGVIFWQFLLHIHKKNVSNRAELVWNNF